MAGKFDGPLEYGAEELDVGGIERLFEELVIQARREAEKGYRSAVNFITDDRISTMCGTTPKEVWESLWRYWGQRRVEWKYYEEELCK